MVYFENINCTYLDPFTETWQDKQIEASVNDYAYHFDKIFSIESIVCPSRCFPLVDINHGNICVYYLEGQKKEAVNELSEMLNHRAKQLKESFEWYESIVDSLVNKGET